jgi:hypothetical protein
MVHAREQRRELEQEDCFGKGYADNSCTSTGHCTAANAPTAWPVPNAASANAYPMTGHPTQTSREIRTIMSIQMLSTVQIADILPTNKVMSYCIDLESPMPVRTYPNTTTLHQIHTNVALVLTLPAVYINVSWNASSHRDHTWEHPGLHYLRFSSHLQFKLVVVV